MQSPAVRPSPPPYAPPVHRWSRSSERKTAHRALAVRHRAASAPIRSQAPTASGENSPCATTSRRTSLLPQTTWQTVKNWLCNAGNALASEANQLSTAAIRIEAGGATLILAGAIAQPEVNPAADVAVGVGVAATATGAAAGTLATVMQMTGGIAQMIGSNDISGGDGNLFAGSVSLLTGGMTGWATQGTSPAIQALVGASVDTGVSNFPGMDAQQAQCGGGN